MAYPTKHIFIMFLTLCSFLVGCGGSKSSNNMWNDYDYRHPAPNVAIPGGSNYGDNYEEYYQDNDASYTPPATYGCSPSDMLGMGCE